MTRESVEGMQHVDQDEANRLSDLWHGVQWEPWYMRLGQYVALFSFVELKTHEWAAELAESSGDDHANNSKMQMGALLKMVRRHINRCGFESGPAKYALRLVDRLTIANEERNDLVHGLHYLSLDSGARVHRALSEDLTADDWRAGAWTLDRLTRAYERLRGVEVDISTARIVTARDRNPHKTSGTTSVEGSSCNR